MRADRARDETGVSAHRHHENQEQLSKVQAWAPPIHGRTSQLEQLFQGLLQSQVTWGPCTTSWTAGGREIEGQGWRWRHLQSSQDGETLITVRRALNPKLRGCERPGQLEQRGVI